MCVKGEPASNPYATAVPRMVSHTRLTDPASAPRCLSPEYPLKVPGLGAVRVGGDLACRNVGSSRATVSRAYRTFHNHLRCRSVRTVKREEPARPLEGEFDSAAVRVRADEAGTFSGTAACWLKYGGKGEQDVQMSEMEEIPAGAKALRSCGKLIRFTPVELAQVKERARAAGQPVACYVRGAALGARRRAPRGIPCGAVVHELARVATRLRALSDSAHARGLPEAGEIAGLIDDVLDIIRRVG